MSAIQALDESILLWIRENLCSDELTPFFRLVTRLGDAGLIWIVLGVLLLLGAALNKDTGGRAMSNQWKDDFTDQLCDAIVAITDRDEAYRFLEDLATFSEIKAFSQRLQVAGLLIKGFSYPQIVQATGASTATISRVKKFVEYGTDGYRDVLRKLESKAVEEEAPKKKSVKK